MKQKTEKKIILYFTLIYANFLIYNFAFAEFKDWKEEIKPGLDVIERKFGLEEYYIPEWIYEPTFELETTDGANNKQLEEANTEEIKDVAEAVPASSDDMPPRGDVVQATSPKVEDLIKNVANRVGFGDVDGLIKIAKCESSLKPECGMLNHPACINAHNNSFDRGYFQISRKWHPEVSDEDAFDLEKSTLHAIRIYKKSGNNWGQWACNNLIK
jgi:hypothetical protein